MRQIFREPQHIRETAETIERYLSQNPGTIISITVVFDASPLIPVLGRVLKTAKISQAEAASGMGMSTPLLCMLLSGKRVLTLAMAEKIRDFLTTHKQCLTSDEQRTLNF